MEDPVNVLLCFIGILVWPGLTLCIILWKLGHPILGIIALLSIESTPKVRKIIVERIIDTKTGDTIELRRTERED
jgi:hypothetical protein